MEIPSRGPAREGPRLPGMFGRSSGAGEDEWVEGFEGSEFVELEERYEVCWPGSARLIWGGCACHGSNASYLWGGSLVARRLRGIGVGHGPAAGKLFARAAG